MLILSRSDLESVVSMREMIDSLERAFEELARGTAVVPERHTISLPGSGAWFGIMPAYLGSTGALSTKIVSVNSQNLTRGLPTTMATILLVDLLTGEALSLMEGSYITAMRTGGLGGLAAKYLSRRDSRIVGIFGAGTQATTQLIALSLVREIKEAYVYDLVAARAESYATIMEKDLNIPVHCSLGPNEVIERSDIVVTASTSKTPVFDGRMLRPGTHINAFGTYRPTDRELDDVTVKRARVFVDLKNAALAEAGDLVIPLKNGFITENHICAELGDIITGAKAGRISENEITLFKSVGVGIQDCAAAWLAYTKAKKEGIGQETNLMA